MTIVELPADLGIESATGLKQLLQPAIAIDAAVQLDGQAVSRLHCASLQLLTAFVLARSQQARSTQINASAALSQGLTLLGLQTVLDDAATPSVP